MSGPTKAERSPVAELMATLTPSMPHFAEFFRDQRLDGGIRMNMAALPVDDLERELALIGGMPDDLKNRLHFDVKGRQMRITQVIPNDGHYLDVRLNHAIEVPTPNDVLFKAGTDYARLMRLEEGGRRLIFKPKGGPSYEVRPGESLHILDPYLRVLGPIFTDVEKTKIERARQAGISKWFLSYVEKQSDVDELTELVGRQAEVRLKIESEAGLGYAANTFVPRDNISLVLARGDLYVEVGRPHLILDATKTVINADPRATVGSRILLSIVNEDVPSCADFSELAWLYDLGYRRYLLCDELCLKGDLLLNAVGAFAAFRDCYTH